MESEPRPAPRAFRRRFGPDQKGLSMADPAPRATAPCRLRPPAPRRARVLPAAVFGALLLAAAPPLAAQEGADGPGRGEGRIVVSAEGTAEAVPDMATLTLGVLREDAAAEAAMEAMSAAADALLATLAEAGIGETDIQTSGLSLTPLRRSPEAGSRGRPEIVGYAAATTVTVRIRDLERLGPVLDVAVGSGANRFRGLTLGLAEPGAVLDEARREAVAEARRRAALYAEAAGVTLGPLLRLQEEGGAPPMPMMRAEMSFADAAAGPPIAEGELTLTARVRLTYALAP